MPVPVPVVIIGKDKVEDLNTCVQQCAIISEVVAIGSAVEHVLPRVALHVSKLLTCL